MECNVLDVDRYLRSESDRAHHGDRVTVPRRILVQHHQRCRCRRPGVLHRLLLEVSSPVRRSVGFLSNSMSRISFHVLNSRSRLTLTGRLHVPIVGPTGRSDWSVRLVGPTIVSYKRFVRPVGQTVGRIKHVCFHPTADPTVEACGHYVRLVGPTGQSDDQSRCSVGGIIIS